MSLDIKLIFGLRTNQQVTVVVTGQPGEAAPELRVMTQGQANDRGIAYQGGAWTATLPAGDHLVRMEAPPPRWFDGEVKFTLSAPSLIVIHGSLASPKPMAWADTSGSVRDPKNPWPPPRLTAVSALPNQTWFGDWLTKFNNQLSVARTAISP